METPTASCLLTVILLVVPVCSYKQTCTHGSNGSTPIILQSTGVRYITSINYPNEYPDNLDYNWTITMPGPNTQFNALKLEVIEFELEDANVTSCMQDKLSIYDGANKLLWVLCDNDETSKVFCIQGLKALIRLQTDGTQCYPGFNISAQPDTCTPNISTTTTLISTRSQSTSVPRSIPTSQLETVRNSSPSSSTPSHSNLSMSVSTHITEGPKGSPKTGAIVGGVVGGLLAAGLLVGLFVFLKPRLFGRNRASVEVEKEPPSDNTDDKTASRATSALFSPPTLIREPTCAPAATFPEPRPLTAARFRPQI